jgi:subtilisin family serine protease
MTMKHLLFFLLLGQAAAAQFTMPSFSQHQWQQIESIAAQGENIKPEEVEAYPVYRINGRYYLSVMGRLNEAPNWKDMRALGVMQGATIGAIATAKIPLSAMAQIDLSQVFTQVEIPSKVAPHLDRVRYDVGVDSVYTGQGLPEGFDGENVLIGITDWGFDYTHPMFYDTLLQQTRVVAAWDQFRNQGPHPAGYTYGTEFNTIDELLAAGGDTANIYSYNTHGSHVAGIAGGSGAGIQYRGMAPAVGFLFTTFLIDAASVIDGYHWMQQVAQEQGKRLVINMSWGLTYMGTLDGTSMLSQVIDQMSEEGVVFVSSAGNNGDGNHHIKHTFDNSEILTRITFDTSTPQPNNWGESITMWGEPNATFWSGLNIYNSLSVLQTSTPHYYTNAMPAYFDSLMVVGADTIFFNIATDASFMTNQRPHMRLRVRTTNSALRVVLSSGAASGTVHYWNVVELLNGVGNWGLPFTSFGTTGVGGDSQYSIAEPTCAASCISVAAYSARYLSNFGNLTGGGIATFTSTGPLMNEVMKPDIAGPGVNVCSSISSWTDHSYTAIDNVTFNGVNYDFARFSGTSMSSPCVAGIVALMLDANPLLTSAQVKEILKATARTDNYTGAITSPGDTRWGMGKVNAYAAVLLSLATQGLNTEEQMPSAIALYPNPATDRLYVKTDLPVMPTSIDFYSLQGERIALPVQAGFMDTSVLSAGIYVAVIETESGRSYVKVVIAD